MYFIIKGATRIYYLNKEGKETNTWFLFKNELLISVFSFYDYLVGGAEVFESIKIALKIDLCNSCLTIC
ncbi:hypothetical protein ACVWYG_003598 [Pedobacter sp. UYEF25]